MLNSVGANSLGELIGQTLPSSIRQKAPLDLGPALSETEALAHMRELASQNQVFTSLIGQGLFQQADMPAVIQRNWPPAWYTAYTPYRPERSARAGSKHYFVSSVIYDLTRAADDVAPTPRCSMKQPPRPRPWRSPNAPRR